jgi:hypothetical protein
MGDTGVSAEKRSSLTVIILPTLLFLGILFGVPVGICMFFQTSNGFVIFIGIVTGLVLACVASVVSYNKILALSGSTLETLDLRGARLVRKRGRKESALDLSREHFSSMESGTSPINETWTVIEAGNDKDRVRVCARNYGPESAGVRFPDANFIGSNPISPYEGLPGYELDAGDGANRSFIENLLALLWDTRDRDTFYLYHNTLPWNGEPASELAKIRVVQGEAAYRENRALINQIRQSALYVVKESYLYINKDYLMLCPFEEKVNDKLITRIIPLGRFPMHFSRNIGSGPYGGDPWEYINVRGVDESDAPREEKVGWASPLMDDAYKATVFRRFLTRKGLVSEK